MPKSSPETRPSAALSLAGFGSLLIILIVLLSGCGLKGDLTLESDSPPASSTEASSDDNQERDKDGDQDNA